MKVLLLANQQAASGRTRRLLPRLLDFLRSRLPELDYTPTHSAAALRQCAADAARAGYDCVIAAGGDGTAHAALNGLVGSPTALGVLPLGKGNDFARALGMPLDPFAAAHALTAVSPSPVDVVRVASSFYACVASVGVDALANRYANRFASPLSGHWHYLLGILPALVVWKPIEVEVVADTGEFRGPVSLVAVANAPSYGGGLRIAPNAQLDDGSVNVCLIEAVSKRELLETYPLLFSGQHLRRPFVRSFRAREVSLRAPAGAELYGDGEFLARLPVTLRVEAAQLKVLRAR
ncbi:MAG: diacylglycerol/lipid kinase family protein [Terriglobia bacterium]